MSLLCVETGRDIKFGSPLMAAILPGGVLFSALSKEVVATIPQESRLTSELTHLLDGINIHDATSTRNFNGSYTVSGFRIGEFRFAISDADAEKLLPGFLARMREEIRRGHGRY
jgi:hypothetical protein